MSSIEGREQEMADEPEGRADSTLLPDTGTYQPEDAPPQNGAGSKPKVTATEGAKRRRGFKEWPITVVCLGIAAGLAYMGMEHFKRGSMIVAIMICVAGILRLVLPARSIGLLAVRGRLVDVLTLTALGVAIAIITYVTPGPN